ncbi:hypothetical protein AKJ16_DCAP11708 [Drosera capensis]
MVTRSIHLDPTPSGKKTRFCSVSSNKSSIAGDYNFVMKLLYAVLSFATSVRVQCGIPISGGNSVVYRVVSAVVLVGLTQIKPYVVHIKVSAGFCPGYGQFN